MAAALSNPLNIDMPLNKETELNQTFMEYFIPNPCFSKSSRNIIYP